MLDRSEIFQTAWNMYRAKSAKLGAAGVAFSRRRFALCLFTAWSNAKLAASVAATMAIEAAERVASPVKAAARAELRSIELQDHWKRCDFTRVAELQSALAA